MKMKKFIFCFIFLLLTTSVFAGERNIVLFFENIENIPKSVLNKIYSSDKLCASATVSNLKNISPLAKSLIITNKIEPTLKIEEPYFTLISSTITISKDISFDRSNDINVLTANYKNSLKTSFDKRKFGLFLKDGILDENTLNLFYKQNIYWTTTQLKNNLNKTFFIKNNVVVFVPFTDIPNEKKSIENWLATKYDEFVPVFIDKTNSTNEKFMLTFLNIIEKNKNYNVCLPVNAAYLIAKNNKQNKISFEITDNIPNDVLLKIAIASQEVNEQTENNEDSQLVSLIYGELTNMYSFNIINGILNNNKFSKQLFDISYENIFKLCGKEIPNADKILQKNFIKQNSNKETSANQAAENKFEANKSGYKINNEQIIKSFGIYKNSQTVNFELNYNTTETDSIYIYIDMNNMAHAGNQKLLNDTGFFVPENCWEYVIEINDKTFKIYRFIVDKINKVAELDKTSQYSIKVPITIFRGNPYNWNYQVVAVKDGEVVDFLETTQVKKEKVFKSKPLLLKMLNIK